MPRRPLSRNELHRFAVSRRNDSDVQALLWEIRRLHEVLVEARNMLAELGSYEIDPERGKRAYAVLRALATEPAVIAATVPDRIRHNPSLPDTRPLRRSKPERGPVHGHAERRAQQVREENEREEKRQAPESAEDDRAAKRAASRARG